MTQDYLNSTRRSITLIKTKWDRGDLQLSPPFQRNPVWSENQKSFLIDTILRGYPVPELYMQEAIDAFGTEKFVVVDGQQRVRACLEFIAGEYALSEPEDSEWFGKRFTDLSTEDRQKIYSYNFMVRQLPEVGRQQLIDIFKRINRYTVSLNQQELRHATYWGEFIATMERIASDDIWSEFGVFSSNDVRRMLDVEFISELAVAFLHGLQNKKLTLDKYYVLYEHEFDRRNELERIFRLTLTELRGVFLLFGSNTRWRKKSDFYTLFLLVAAAHRSLPLTATHRKAVARRLQNFGGLVDRFLTTNVGRTSTGVKKYALAVERAASDLANRKARQQVLEAILAPALPKRKSS